MIYRGLPILLLLAIASESNAEQLLREIDWKQQAAAGALHRSVGVEKDAESDLTVIKVENDSPEGITVNIATILQPGITSASYAITGRVRYENVQGSGYLEMWNYFPEGGMYFSRTLGDSGPMQRLSGTSAWRAFTLPFKSEGELRPDKVQINVVMPGTGTVYVSPIRLVQFDAAGANTVMGHGWWSNKAGIWLGIIGGVLAGLMGAVIGSLLAVGRGQQVVLTTAKILFLSGVFMFIAGLIAISVKQPYAVAYPLLLLGGICSLTFGLNLPVIKRRYQQIELRRMEAMDLG